MPVPQGGEIRGGGRDQQHDGGRALAGTGADLRPHTIDDVQVAFEAMRTRADGTPASGASVNTVVAAVKALLNFAHKVGFSRFKRPLLTHTSQ